MVSPNHIAAKEVDLLCPDHHLIWYGLIVDSGPRISHSVYGGGFYAWSYVPSGVGGSLSGGLFLGGGSLSGGLSGGGVPHCA